MSKIKIFVDQTKIPHDYQSWVIARDANVARELILTLLGCNMVETISLGDVGSLSLLRDIEAMYKRVPGLPLIYIDFHSNNKAMIEEMKKIYKDIRKYFINSEFSY